MIQTEGVERGSHRQKMLGEEGFGCSEDSIVNSEFSPLGSFTGFDIVSVPCNGRNIVHWMGLHTCLLNADLYVRALVLQS